jgi:FAD/FMN-containing dehydrogenase
MLNPADITFAATLAHCVPGLSLRPAPPSYLEEPRGLYHGRETLVAAPTTTDEVAAIVRAAAGARVGILPYGGGTGLVSGQISPSGPAPLILSLEKMTGIRAVYPSENALVADAGASLAKVQAASAQENLLFPLSYASQDSASIGGALAVNSGGLNVLRYGMARNLCLGIEAVLPDGSIFHGLKRLRKDNTGYDLRHLLIGAEGTLGVITAAALTLVPRPERLATAFLAVKSPSAALDLLNLTRHRAGDTISAFEVMSREGFSFLTRTHPDLRQPFDTPADWSVLVELGTGPGADPETMLAEIFETAFDRGLVTDGAIAQSGQQQQDFWTLRESMPASNRRIGAICSHDISLPLSEIPAFLDEAEPAIRAITPCRINTFGHLGDGNLHYNVFPPEGENRDAYRHLAPDIMRVVHDMAVARGGSFSAEHGIGRLKVEELRRYGDPAKLAAMRAIKTALDPHGIMNPGAVLGQD